MSRNYPGARHLGLSSVFKSITKSLKPASGNVPVVVNAKVVGGGADMPRLLYQLQNGNLPQRTQAAQEIMASIDRFSISSIPEIWYSARDMCHSKFQPAIRRTAVKLMVLCIRQDEGAVSSRLLYFSDIAGFCEVGGNWVDPEFDIYLKALRELTSDGRDIHDIYVYDGKTTWGGFLLKVTNALSSRITASESDEDAVSNMIKLTTYVSNCFKFNFGLLEEQFVIDIISLIRTPMVTTGDEALLLAFIDLLKSTASFGFLPNQVYGEMIRLLCGISMRKPDLLDACLEVIKLLSAELALALSNVMCDTLVDTALAKYLDLDWDHPSGPEVCSALGALTIIENLLLHMEKEMFLDVALVVENILRRFLAALQTKISLVNSGILRLMSALFATTEKATFPGLFPFQIWYKPNSTIFQVLHTFDLESSSDLSYWTLICSSLYDRLLTHELMVPEDKVIQVLLRKPSVLKEAVTSHILQHYASENMCTLLNTSWRENCRGLLAAFNSDSVNASTRIRVLRMVKASHEKSFSIFGDVNVPKTILLEIILSASEIKNPEVQEYVVSEFLGSLLRSALPHFHSSILNVLSPMLLIFVLPQRILSITSFTSAPSSLQVNSTASTIDGREGVLPLFLILLSKTIAGAFAVTLPQSAQKAAENYKFLVTLLLMCIENGHHLAALNIIRVLVCIRVTEEGYVFLSPHGDVEGIASAFKRSKQSCDGKEKAWAFPESLDFLPSAFLNKPNVHLLLFDSSSSRLGEENDWTIDINLWLDIVARILDQYYHWEIYSYTWTHFCQQMSNIPLFTHQNAVLLRLHKIVCEQLTLNLPKSLVLPTELTKANLQVAIIRCMSGLLGHHDQFSKSEEDNIVNLLLFALGSWEKTAIPCIHILTVCCYELPMSVKRFLTAILNKLQGGVTSAFASSPTLEFLISLLNTPLLTVSFSLNDYRQVIAIAFKYIQFGVDHRKRASSVEMGGAPSYGKNAEVNNLASTEDTETTPRLTEYLLVVSQIVVSRWFTKLELGDRRQISSFIVKNIVLAFNLTSVEDMDESVIALLDIVARFTYSNIPLKITSPGLRTNLEPYNLVHRWIMGHSIVTIGTDPMTGNSRITLRRPTGVLVMNVTIDPSMLPENMDTTKPMILDGYLLLQLLKPMDIKSTSKPLALFDDAATERAISAFDRIPVVSHHKAGIIYIGPGQTEEAEILGNTIGLRAYQDFLDKIGDLIKLKSCDAIYVGGLDRENGTDGDYAVFWSDQLSQLIFHTTTMMPNMAGDKYFASKKRHIGNNYVNVFFDESGEPFNFNVVKSQFNFINIVITPPSKSHSGAKQPFYKVKTYRRSGVPGIFSSSHFKMISLDQVGSYVCNSVLMSDRFARVWNDSVGGVYTTNWHRRVQQIETLRLRTLEMHRQDKLEQESREQEKMAGSTTQSFLEQLQETKLPMPMTTTAITYEHVGPQDGSIYKLVEFNSFV